MMIQQYLHVSLTRFFFLFFFFFVSSVIQCHIAALLEVHASDAVGPGGFTCVAVGLSLRVKKKNARLR